jgi:hypothetical protein
LSGSAQHKGRDDQFAAVMTMGAAEELHGFPWFGRTIIGMPMNRPPPRTLTLRSDRIAAEEGI